MKLKDIVLDYGLILGDKNLEITGLYHNSSEVKEGGLFFAIEGTKVNGEDYILDAINNGAKAIVTSSDKDFGVCKVKVNNVRKAMSLFSCNFYNNPSKDMIIISVTGTNGKTTSTFMLESVLKAAGYSVGIIGTNGVYLNGKKLDTNLTTPDPIYLQKTLSYFKSEGVEVVCMEVSAHALYLDKTYGIMTDIALFTNLTQDHLDFFDNMRDYGDSKAKLFTGTMSKIAVVNLDDDFGKNLYKNRNIKMIGYSKNGNEADIIATPLSHNKYNSFKVKIDKSEEQINLKLLGSFNISNALGVIGAMNYLGIDLSTIKFGLENLTSVSGRFNVYEYNDIKFIIDYAHTPDGLFNILSETNKITKGKVICVFGCGGNRDNSKREIMGKIASENSAFCFITNDNPRFEEPIKIANDIAKGIKGNNYQIELDRKEAIKKAVSMARTGDSVVITGKGTETYMEVMGEKLAFDDKEALKEIIKINI